MHVPRRTVLGGIATVGISTFASVTAAAGGTASQGDGRTAEVRVGHLSPDAPAVDVYVGKSPDGDPTVGGLSYTGFAPGTSDDYLALPAGSYDVSVTPAGATSPLVIDVDGFPLEPNRDYTLLAVGELSPEAATFGSGDEPAIQPLALVDNADEETALPPADAALLRAVHASPDAGAVDVAVDGTVVQSGVEFADASPYLELPPGERTVSVLKGDATALEVTLPVEAGTKLSGYVVGNVTTEDGDMQGGVGEGLGSLGALVTLDATSPAKGRGRGP